MLTVDSFRFILFLFYFNRLMYAFVPFNSNYCCYYYTMFILHQIETNINPSCFINYKNI